jgi:hypothetical protein
MGGSITSFLMSIACDGLFLFCINFAIPFRSLEEIERLLALELDWLQELLAAVCALMRSGVCGVVLRHRPIALCWSMDECILMLSRQKQPPRWTSDGNKRALRIVMLMFHFNFQFSL